MIGRTHKITKSPKAHSSVEKAAMIALVKLRILETDSNFRLRGETLQSAITVKRGKMEEFVREARKF